MPAPQEGDGEVQIVLVSSKLPDTIEATLEQEPMTRQFSDDRISEEQFKDLDLRPIIFYLRDGTLLDDAKLVVVESTVYAICNDVLYYIGTRQMDTARLVVPQRLRQKITMMDNWLDTSQDEGYTRTWLDAGGCHECTVM